MPFMYRTPCVNKYMKYSCYVLTSFFATCDERFAMDCIVALFVGNLIYLGYDRVLEKRFGESWKIYRIFRKQESTYPACGQFSS